MVFGFQLQILLTRVARSNNDYRMTTMIWINLLVVIFPVFKRAFIKETNCCHLKGSPESFALFLFLCFLTAACKLKWPKKEVSKRRLCSEISWKLQGVKWKTCRLILLVTAFFRCYSRGGRTRVILATITRNFWMNGKW